MTHSLNSLVDSAINSSIHRIWQECQNKSLWRTERDRQITIREWSSDFSRANLPIPE